MLTFILIGTLALFALVGVTASEQSPAQKLYSFAELRDMAPLNRLARRLSLACLWRWSNDGVLMPDGSRLYLKAQRFGRMLVSSPEAVQEFLDKLEAAHQPSERPTSPEPAKARSRTRRQRERSRANAQKVLAIAGLK
jgi:hypothetical protein